MSFVWSYTGSLVVAIALSQWRCSADEYLTTDELENYISPEDLAGMSGLDLATTPDAIEMIGNRFWGSATDEEDDLLEVLRVPKEVDCFGAGVARRLSWLVNLRPGSTQEINTHFFFSTRKQRHRVQVYAGDQFGLEWVDYDPKRQTVVIIHGFMSHSNASWVRNMTKAFLDWADVNVITVDWSRGGNTWKYWRAVANTRRVGADVTQLIRQLMTATGCVTRDFHFVGHSLGAHICSYAAAHLGGVRRITGLDPAQPCFQTTDKSVMLDETDAEFVDVIHTNGRLVKRLGLGLPDPSGHADFYPNGGMKQPGCYNTSGFFSRLLPISPTKLSQAICSHGRSYVLFTESLFSRNCSFRAHRWNMTLEGVNASLQAACDRVGSCSEMGIYADGRAEGLPRARGRFFVLTTASKPYCPSEFQRHHPDPLLLHDLTKGFQLDSLRATPPPPPPQLAPPDSTYADPEFRDVATTKRPFWKFWSG